MIFSEQQQQQHETAMLAICQDFQKHGQARIVKGGAALKLCYQLDRFCETLHLDSHKLLNLEHAMRDTLVFLGKSQAQYRGAVVTLAKKTPSVHRYRVEFADKMVLKIEDHLRDDLDEAELVEVNGVLTYKASLLIKRKIQALQDRATARDLHDVIFLYSNYFTDFDEDDLSVISELYKKQSDLLTEFSIAYQEALILDEDSLMEDLMMLVERVEERMVLA